MTFGDTSNRLALDLGGVPRTFTSNPGHTLRTYNSITNGSVFVTGGGYFKLFTDEATGYGVDFTVDKNTFFYFDSSADTRTGAVRARDVTLRSGTLRVIGNKAADSVETLTGDLIVDSHPEGTINTIYMDTYTGDTIFHGRVEVKHPDILPHGDRTGDLYINGSALIGNYSSTPFYINGLNGGGILYGIQVNLYVGDNDANGMFTGNYIVSKYTCYLTKVGTGMQVFSGNVTINGGIDIEAGALVLDGLFSYGSTVSGVDVEDGGTLRGKGAIDIPGIATAINVQAGATLAPGSTDGFGTMTVAEGDVVFADGAEMALTLDTAGYGALSVSSNVTGQATVPIAFSGEGVGKWKILEAASIEPTFESATSGVILSLANGGTELWAERLDPVTLIVVR